MKIDSFFAVVIGFLAVGAASGADVGPDIGRSDNAASAVHQRLAQSLASLQSVYDATRKPGTIRRRDLWRVGGALPWRSTLQPSCLRSRDYQLQQPPGPWPSAADAPSLRALLTDPVPGLRALAAEALATLHQPEDLPRLAALLADSAEAPMEPMAPSVGQQASFEVTVGPGPDAVTRYAWHPTTVASHAAWGLYVLLGDCCPERVFDLQFTRFGAYGAEPSTAPPAVDPAILAPLAAGDPKDHLWYWQEYIHRALHQRDKEWISAFVTEMRGWPAERRAMVRLLASDVHQGGTDMAYYDTPGQWIFTGPLELGLEKKRVLELLDGIRLWPDERRDRGGRSQVVERLALGWRECFTAEDAPRLLAHFSNPKEEIWWSARAALVVALAHLLPATGTASEDPATAEGFLRRTLRQDPDVFIRTRAALELLRMDPDIHWPLLTDRFFADRDNGDYLPLQILEWLKKAPAGDRPTRKLVDLVSDERFRPLWLEPERLLGKGTQGGRCRRLAAEALNARLGGTVVAEQDLRELKDPEKGPARLRLILERVHENGKRLGTSRSTAASSNKE